jgi:hypothetical protein
MIDGSNPNAVIGRYIKLSVCTLFNSMFAHRSPVTASVWRQDTQHNSTMHNDTQHNEGYAYAEWCIIYWNTECRYAECRSISIIGEELVLAVLIPWAILSKYSPIRIKLAQPEILNQTVKMLMESYVMKYLWKDSPMKKKIGKD